MGVVRRRSRRTDPSPISHWARRLDDSLPMLLVTIVAGFAGTSVVIARARYLWNDELFTWYFATLPSLGDVWSRLGGGAEQLPPSFYLLTRAMLDVFGTTPLTLRILEVLAFAGAGGVLFVLVARRVRAIYALVAVLFLFVSSARYYGSEARPYALVLLCAATALLSWEVAAEGGARRRLALVGLAVSMAGATGSHYFGVLLVVPLAAGELVRAWERRRMDVPMLAAISAVLLPLIVFFPLIRAASGFGTAFWAPATWSGIPDFYGSLLWPVWAWLPVAGVLGAAAIAVLRRRRPLPAPIHELAALAALSALPIAGVVVGKLVTGAFTDRYALPAVLGVAILLALAMHVLDGQAPVIAVAAVAVLLAVGGAFFLLNWRATVEAARAQQATLRFLGEQRRPGVPLVVADPQDFFELSHLVARQGGPTLTYLADPSAAVRYVGTDTADLGLEQLQGFAPLRVLPYARAPRRFLLWGVGAQWDWLSKRLRADGRTLVPRAREGGRTLYEVEVQAE